MVSSTGARRLVAQALSSLNGSLTAAAFSSFTPDVGPTYDLLDWGTVSGSFSSISLPPLASDLVWNSSQLYAAGADLVIWQRGGSPHLNSAVDLVAIEGAFGLAAAAPVARSVPEPDTILLIALTACPRAGRRFAASPVRGQPASR